MKLIVHVVKDQADLMEFVDIHHYGTLHIKQEHLAPQESAGFSTQPDENPIWTSHLSWDFVNKKVKKLGWFEKMMLCMNLEIHKKNYSQYRETRKLRKQNKEIL
jgi:hypothetical protein